MKIIKYLTCFCLVVAGFALSSCTKQDDYKKFIAGGEITYPARVDSVIVQSGNMRIQLRVALSSDPSITKVKAYWNSRTDSTEVNVVRTGPKDTVNVMINNLTEGVYNFEVFTYNNKNNSSVVKNASGSAYGQGYYTTLSNRIVRSSGLSADGKAFINWDDASTGEIGVEIKYTDKDNVDKTVIVPASSIKTELISYKDGSQLTYRSLFKPDNSSIDVFSVPSSSLTLPVYEKQLPKSDFKVLVLPTDATDGFGWVMTNLWNDTYTGSGFATQNGKAAPLWFTFDTGLSTVLSKVTYWMPSDRIFNKEAVKSFEIWGSNNPAADGSWGSWTLLTTCLSVKPSGSALGTNTAEDIAAAAAGQNFVMPAGIPKARYIRIKALSNWGNGAFQAMGELTFFTKER